MTRTRNQRTSRGGFTIIELLIVVIVIGVLAAAGISKYQGFAETARTKTCLANQHTIENAIGMWCTQNATLPDTVEGCAAFNTLGVSRNVGGGTAPTFVGAGATAAAQNQRIANVIREPKTFVCPRLAQRFNNIAPTLTGGPPAIPAAGNGLTQTGATCNIGNYIFYYNGPGVGGALTGAFALGVTGSWFDPQGNAIAHQLVWCGGYGGYNCDAGTALARYLHSDRWAQF